MNWLEAAPLIPEYDHIRIAETIVISSNISAPNAFTSIFAFGSVPRKCQVTVFEPKPHSAASPTCQPLTIVSSASVASGMAKM